MGHETSWGTKVSLGQGKFVAPGRSALGEADNEYWRASFGCTAFSICTSCGTHHGYWCTSVRVCFEKPGVHPNSLCTVQIMDIRTYIHRIPYDSSLPSIKACLSNPSLETSFSPFLLQAKTPKTRVQWILKHRSPKISSPPLSETHHSHYTLSLPKSKTLHTHLNNVHYPFPPSQLQIQPFPQSHHPRHFATPSAPNPPFIPQP